MRKIISAFTFLFLLGCSHKAADSTKNELPKDKMIQILLDLHLTEANTDAVKVSNKEEEMEKLATEYEKIFKKNGVTAKQFYSSFDYMLNHPAEMDSIYKDLVDVATQQQSELLKSMKSNNAADSLKRIIKNKLEMMKHK